MSCKDPLCIPATRNHRCGGRHTLVYRPVSRHVPNRPLCPLSSSSSVTPSARRPCRRVWLSRQSRWCRRYRSGRQPPSPPCKYGPITPPQGAPLANPPRRARTLASSSAFARWQLRRTDRRHGNEAGPMRGRERTTTLSLLDVGHPSTRVSTIFSISASFPRGTMLRLRHPMLACTDISRDGSGRIWRHISRYVFVLTARGELAEEMSSSVEAVGGNWVAVLIRGERAVEEFRRANRSSEGQDTRLEGAGEGREAGRGRVGMWACGRVGV